MRQVAVVDAGERDADGDDAVRGDGGADGRLERRLGRDVHDGPVEARVSREGGDLVRGDVEGGHGGAGGEEGPHRRGADVARAAGDEDVRVF